MLNSLDQRLLLILRRDARIATAALARQLEVSRSTVQSRIQRMESLGIIRGYSVILGESHQRQWVRAHVLIAVEQRLTPRLNKQLEGIAQIAALHAISGEFDLIVEVEAEGTQALNHLLDHISGLDGVLRTQTSVILETRFRR